MKRWCGFLFLITSLALAQAPQRTQRTPPQIGTTSNTGPHQAILNWSNASCTTNAQCSLQVYRATCTSATSCPTYSPGNSAWKTLDMTVGLTPQIGANGSSWSYIDKDTALQDSTTYVWVATCTFVGGTSASAASANWSGTTNNGTPPAPTVASTGNSVN
jgi:hypothetical protein